MGFNYIFQYAAAITVLIPLAYCIPALKKNAKVKHKNKPEYGVLTCLLMLTSLSVIINIVTYVYVKAGLNSLLYFNLYTPLEFILISFLYTHLIPKWTKLIYVLMLVFLVFFVVDSYWLESIKTIQDNPLVVEDILVVFYCVVHMVYMYQVLEGEPPVHHQGAFWITVALFGYFAYDIGLFFMANKVLTKTEPATARMIWNFNNANYILRNLLLTLGIYRIYKTEVANHIDYKRYGLDPDWKGPEMPDSKVY